MSSKKPSIPSLDGIPDGGVRKILSPLKDIIEQLLGRRGGKIQHLGPTPATGDIVNKINEIIDRLQV
jgi:hypothetical protein